MLCDCVSWVESCKAECEEDDDGGQRTCSGDTTRKVKQASVTEAAQWLLEEFARLAAGKENQAQAKIAGERLTQPEELLRQFIVEGGARLKVKQG